MFSLFKKQTNSSVFQKNLLNNTELLELRALAEQLDSSVTPNLILDSRQAGSLPTRALGSGIDYAESRVYQYGDNPRSINWRLSARSQETFVKTYHIESRPSLCILLDRRRSMVFGTRQRLKITQAVRVASLLAYASEYHHLNFQAWIVDDQNIAYFDELNPFLFQANLAPRTTTPPNITNNRIFSVLPDILQRSSKGALVYFISDFEGLADSKRLIASENQANLAQLNEHCVVQAIHIIDKAESTLANLGKVRLQDMQQDAIYKLDTRKEKERLAFSEAAKQIIEDRKSIFTDLGITYSRLTTEDEDIQNTITLALGQT